MNRFGVYLMGGLGNQIFQYLFALKLREHVGDKVFLFIDWFQGNQLLGREANRPLLLNRLPGIKIPLTTLGLAVEANIAFAKIHRYETEGGFAGLNFEQGDNMLVIGYFQSASSLPSQAEVAEFCRGIITDPVDDMPNTVALHLRIGDYKNIQNVLPILPIAYYAEALETQPANSRFIVFSEDVTEAKEFLTPLAERFHFEFHLPSDPVVDFRRLASMPVILGANSTFSYLAGLAALQNGARVYLPAAEYWHGTNYTREIEGKRELLNYANFRLIP